MMDKASFKKGIGRVFRTAEFAGKGNSWYLSGSNCTVVLNFQKSDFEEKFYVNFAVWLKDLGTVDFPAANKCHIQARLTSLFPVHVEAIDRGSRIGCSREEFAAFTEFLRDEVVPFCKDCLQTEGLRSKLEAGVFKSALIMKTAKDALANA